MSFCVLINNHGVMKNSISQLLVLISMILLTASCQKGPFVTLNTPRSFTFTRDGGTQSITFACNRDWSVSSSESWIQVSPPSGSASDGAITVMITCAANTTYDPRSAVITVKVEELSEAISISQDSGLGLIVSPKTFDLTNAEQTIEIEVQKNVQYSVAIDNESAAWIKQGGTKALTTDKVTFTVAANTSYDNREGKIVFKQLDGNLSETVVVRQSQINGLFITTPNYSLSNEAHTLSVEVKANVDFDVSSQADWITYVETKALKASTITLSIPANEGYDNRTGTVLVKQKNGDLAGTITITQKQTDYLEVTPNSFDLDNQLHEIELKVTQNVAYSIVIPDDAKNWVYVPTKAATKGLVEDTVRLVVDANSTYDDREASVTIKQNDGSLAGTVAIKQAYGEGLIVEKTTYDIGEEGGTIEVAVQANVEYQVSPEVDWIHYMETKALSSSTVLLAIDENASIFTREGKVEITQKNGALKQTVAIRQAGQIAVTHVDLNTTDVMLEEGETITLAATVKPENSYDKSIMWSSSDESVVTVDINGKVTAISKGMSTITATANDGSGVYASCDVTVYRIDTPNSIDLGLPSGIKWASFNLGASAPEEYGLYYAWGETMPKSEYSWATYKWCNGSAESLTKYNPNSSYGIVDNKTQLDDEDDVAHEKLGGAWRIPTDVEWQELIDNCTRTWVPQNEVRGWLLTSKINGNSIFLPASGKMDDTSRVEVNLYGYFWSSNLYSHRPFYAWCLYYYSGISVGNNIYYRYYGFSVRPVTK